MPDINADTPREDYTIAGHTFSILQPYTEGHVLTTGEASAMNQVFAENIRNNFAAKVKEAEAAGSFESDVFQGQLDDYMIDYEFGVRRGGGGRTGDPIQSEALIIAKDKVRKALVKRGHALKEVPASEITRLAKDILGSGKYPEILDAAKARVAAQLEVADVEIGDVQTETASDESAPKAKKTAAK